MRPAPSFLDLTAIPAVGAELLSEAPAWVWTPAGDRVLWANLAGIRFFGETRLDALLAREFSPGGLVAREIARASADLTDQARAAMLRLPAGGRVQVIAVKGRRLEGSDAILLSSAQRAPAAGVEDRAERLATALAGDDITALLIAGDGTPLAMPPQRELADTVALAALARAALDSPSRTARSTVRFGDSRRPVGVAVASADGQPVVLALVGNPEPATEPRFAMPTLSERAAAIEGAPLIPVEAAPDLCPPIEAPTPVSIAPTPVSEAPEPAPPRPNPTRSEDSAFRFQPRPAPVRFAFQTDAEQRVTFVSPELAGVVGADNAQLVGRPWADIAADLGLDAEPVDRALSRRDTWSGLTVYWPVSGADLAVAVDLAALPAFGRGGGFEGFRGFGVCRTDDIRRTGQPAAAAATLSEPPVAEPASSNVVRLPSAGSSSQRVAPLTGDERDAFRRIAQALREVMPRRPTDPPTPSSPPPASRERAIPEAKLATAPQQVPIRLLDRLPVGLLVFRDRSVLFASRTLLDQLGYSDVAALAAAGGADALFAEPMVADVFEDQRRLMLRAADGEQIAAEARLHIVPWEDGSATMLSIRQPDRPRDPFPTSPPELLRLAAISAPEDHRRLEDFRDALQRIEELEAVLDTATDGVVVLDGIGRIMSANRSAEALFGVETTEMLGRPFTDFLAEESRRSALDYLDGLARNGVASVLNDGREVIALVPQGGMIPLFMTMGRLGDSEKFCAVLRDITQWKNAEEELVAARRAAESANHHKSEFLAKVSHEIRTPLNAVIGFAEVMLEERFGPIGNKRYRDYLADIRLSGTHLMSLINDLLDLSKIEAGKLDLALDEVPLNDVIQECVGLMQPQANRERVIIRTSLSVAVPKVVADLRSLRQILLNLLSNAVKFTPAGGQVIISSALEDSGEVVVRIRDTGVGMSAKELEVALKPFRQVATAGRPRAEGTGLGLPLTKALVEANRASFAIDSAPSQGTLVRITFPVTRVLAG